MIYYPVFLFRLTLQHRNLPFVLLLSSKTLSSVKLEAFLERKSAPLAFLSLFLYQTYMDSLLLPFFRHIALDSKFMVVFLKIFVIQFLS